MNKVYPESYLSIFKIPKELNTPTAIIEAIEVKKKNIPTTNMSQFNFILIRIYYLGAITFFIVV